MVRKHKQIYPVPLVPNAVILNEVLGKCKILPGAHKIFFSNSAQQPPVSGFL